MVRTQYMTMFTQCGTDTAKAIVAAKRGLGSQFKAAVTQLLQENKKAEKHEIVAAFDVAIEAMEDAAKAVLVEAFGEVDESGKQQSLTLHVPAFRQYKSNYRKLLRKLGAEAASLPDLGPGAVNKKLAELSKPAVQGDDTDNKGPATESKTDTSTTGGDTNTGKSGGKHKPLDPEVQKHLDNYAAALANLPKERALGMVKKSEDIAWGAVKNLGNHVAKFANKKDAA
jgi:hypothetical protein